MLPIYNGIFVTFLISKFILKVFFYNFADQNPVWLSPSKTFALIVATNIQRKIDEMEQIRAMTDCSEELLTQIWCVVWP